MACIESPPRTLLMYEPPEKKRKTGDEKTKNTLLEALKGVEDEIKTLGHSELQERLEKLRGQVEVVLENQEQEIKHLQDEIESLKKEIDKLKVKHEKLENSLTVAQVTWVWEAHVARFVVGPSEEIYQLGRFSQMEQYLEKNTGENRWEKIQNKLEFWTKAHKKMVENLRDERNRIAHAHVDDLESAKSEIENIVSPHSEKLVEDMFDMVKMTASLMKFGRLAKFYKTNKHLFPRPSGKGLDARALKEIISWDRDFDEINGLQSIEHEEAKGYMDKYVNDSSTSTINPYYFIVDFIKEGNKKRLGKLAWKIEASGLLTDLSETQGKALNQLKQLLPSPGDVSEALSETIAKLHVLDFLPEELRKQGMEIVEEYFHMHASLTKFTRLAKFYKTNENLFPTSGPSGKGLDALENIISWDRDLDQINRLPSIKHEKAKNYMAKYVKNRATINDYYFIVDFIKDGNEGRLGKLAWEIEASGIMSKLSRRHGKALNKLKELLPDRKDESEALNETIAKLHVPDFLPKYWWKHGLEIVERYFRQPHHSRVKTA